MQLEEEEKQKKIAEIVKKWEEKEGRKVELPVEIKQAKKEVKREEQFVKVGIIFFTELLLCFTLCLIFGMSRVSNYRTSKRGEKNLLRRQVRCSFLLKINQSIKRRK